MTGKVQQFREACQTFRECRSPSTAADYLDALIMSQADDLLDDDAFLDGLGEIRDYLRRPFPRQD